MAQHSRVVQQQQQCNHSLYRIQADEQYTRLDNEKSRLSCKCLPRVLSDVPCSLGSLNQALQSQGADDIGTVQTSWLKTTKSQQRHLEKQK